MKQPPLSSDGGKSFTKIEELLIMKIENKAVLVTGRGGM
jgi:hypothetical protein